MKETLTYRKAEKADVERIWEIILEAKEQMRRRNSCQWQDGYPTVQNITGDIENGYGSVLCANKKVIAYAAVVFDGEPAYDHIKGKWLTDLPYVVVHRLAVSDEVKNKGVATFFMQKIEELSRQQGIGSFRADTNFDNLIMQKILYALDFTYCGDVFYVQGQRRAYEKKIR